MGFDLRDRVTENTTTLPTTVQSTSTTINPIVTTTINEERLDVIVLNDRKCSTCDTSRIIAITRNIFPTSNIIEIDINTEEGRALAEQYDILVLPAYIFGSNLPEMKNYQRNANAFEKRGDKYVLKPDVTGASHYVSEEARRKFLERICKGIEKVEKPNFKIFYMSFCPFGIQAMKAIAPVANLFKNKVEIEPHFVIYENYLGGGPEYCIENGQLCSMHGINELNEDIRQACVWKYEKEKFWNYTMCVMNKCSLTNVETCWESCAEKVGVDIDRIKDCQSNEGASLMSAEKELNERYNVRGSPTMFLNDKLYQGRRTPEDIKNYICCAFMDRPGECNISLGISSSTVSGGTC